MFHILIIDPDPLVSMDIADAARRFHDGIGIREARNIDAARALMGAAHPFSHVFLRSPRPDQLGDALRFIVETSGKDTTVILVGAEQTPEAVPDGLSLMDLSMPFSSEMLDALLARIMPAACGRPLSRA